MHGQRPFPHCKEDQSLTSEQDTIAIIGLGYVGLPLAVAFGRKRRVIGFDIDRQRIAELAEGVDRTREVAAD